MVFVTSRILVVDLLRQQCSVDCVSGLLVWSAHKSVSVSLFLSVSVSLSLSLSLSLSYTPSLSLSL